MGVAILIAMVVMISFIFFKNLKGNDNEKNLANMRKNQIELRFRENALKKKFEAMATEKVSVSKRHKIETKCLQAGYNISYGEYKIICVSVAIILPIAILIILDNGLLALSSILLGYVLPEQFISYKGNKRIEQSEKQVGSFMKLVIERYKTNNEFTKSIRQTVEEFEGQEPMFTEIKKTVLEIDNAVPTGKALDNLALRMGNKYLERFADFYKLATDLGTQDERESLLNQAYIQYEEERKIKSKLRKEIQGPKSEAYLIFAGIPAIVIYQCLTSKDYIHFMTQTTIGKIGSTIIVAIAIACLWFINTQIGKPLD